MNLTGIEHRIEPKLSDVNSHDPRADEDLRRRLVRFFLFLAAAPAFTLVLRGAMHVASHQSPREWPGLAEAYHAAGIALALLFALLARQRTVSSVGLRWIDLVATPSILSVYLVVASFLDAQEAAQIGDLFSTLCATATLFVRALFVPSTSSRTSAVGFTCLCLVYAFIAVTPPSSAIAMDSTTRSLYWTTWGVPTVLATLLATRSLRFFRHRDRLADVLGSYQLREEVDKGGMGTIYRARHRLLQTDAAIKVVRDVDPSFSRRFFREAKVLATLRHPHTVRLFDFGTTENNQLYYVMEMLAGSDLQKHVIEHGPLRPLDACDAIIQTASALAEAHERGLVHRDLKPSNLFLLRDGSRPVIPHRVFIKVLDFGLVRRLGSSSQPDSSQTNLSQTSSISGTPLYMAPEQIERPDEVTSAADIYALGCVLFFLVMGKPLVTGDSAISVMAQHLEVPAAKLLNRGPELPAPLRSVILECIAKNTDERWSSVYELIDGLTRAKRDLRSNCG
ncbi:MAG: serine/threonine-protein kinase [Myxococcota bacterium]